MAGKRSLISSVLGRVFSSVGKIALVILAVPSAIMLLRKHSVIKSDGKEAYLYTFGKKAAKSGGVFVTNQTPSKVLGSAVKNCFKK